MLLQAVLVTSPSIQLRAPLLAKVELRWLVDATNLACRVNMWVILVHVRKLCLYSFRRLSFACFGIQMTIHADFASHRAQTVHV